MADVKTADELQELLKQAEADKAALQSKLDDALKQAEDALSANGLLTKEIEKMSSGVVKTAEEKVANLAEHVFEWAGKKFGFNYPKLTIKGQTISPVEVKASPELQKQLVESKSSMIKEL